MQMRVLVFLALAAFLLGWIAGCSSDTPSNGQCATDQDCPSSQGCLAGLCRARCTTASECESPKVCLSGYCQQFCSSDSDCPRNEVCRNGTCGASPGTDGGDSGPWCEDQDGDKYGENCALGPDCNDQDPAIHPGATENCQDNVDNDCDGKTDSEDLDCICKFGETRPCYDGPAGTAGIGICRLGIAVCDREGLLGPCQGQRLPEMEACDKVDNDCDGETDEALLNACGKCGDVPPEQCGDGLDNDCDGLVDEGCGCDPECQCQEGGSGSNCVCHPPTHQPCYSGNPMSLGLGICRGGFHDCQLQADGSYQWGECQGEVLPGIECANNVVDQLDNDCDGATDEDCLPDMDGDGYAPPQDCDDNDPAIHPGAPEICNGKDDNCNGLVDEGVTNACGGCGDVPQEVCGDGLDNDCDGQVDESCGGCSASDPKPCYRGTNGTQGIGNCKWGVMTCDGEFWSECSGDVIPQPEVCDGQDNDCDGETDERWANGSNACGWCDSSELCDNIDNDCDGLTDEGLRNGCGQCLSEVVPETQCDNIDNDCDGLTDEGLLNACGRCPDEPACYQQEWNTPGDCTDDLRTCNGVEPDPGNPDAITLGQGSVHTPFIYIAVTGEGTVAKLNTETGEKLWEVPSHGDRPSRTAVALDYSVWVANRGLSNNSANAGDPNYSNAVHLDADGNLICRVDAVGIARGVAIDGRGRVWIGTYNGQTLYEVDGQQVNATDCSLPPTQDLPNPCCKVWQTINVGVSVYGLAIDGNGYLWTASNPTKRVDTSSGAIVAEVANSSYYGIAIDQNGNAWFGGWNGAGTVHRIDVNSDPMFQVFQTSVLNVTGVTVAADGSIWGSSYGTDEVVKIDPVSGLVVCRAPVPALGTNLEGGIHPRPHGVALDDTGMVWVPHRYGGWASRFHSDCTQDPTTDNFVVHEGAELYTYSDMTGMQLRIITTREGHWVQVFDSGYAAPIWNAASWIATVPDNTSIAVSFISADTEAELSSNPSPLCGPFTMSPANLLSCQGLQGHRWLSADVQLNSTLDGYRPTFSDLKVFWSR